MISDRASDEFYRLDVVQDLAIEVSDADLAAMDAQLPATNYVPATFRWRDQRLENVGLRYKSSVELSSPNKRGYVLKFDEFVPDQRFLGLKRAGLDSANQGGSVFSVPLLSQVLPELGIINIRSNFARLTFNGEYHGVYVNEERVDKTFLARHFGDNGGDLYKSDEIEPGSNLAYLGDSPGAYWGLELQTNEDTSDGSSVIGFIRTINQTSDQEFAATMTETFAMDGYLRLMAALMLAGAYDQYTGVHPHNYYLYREPTTKRWHFIPWDLDNAFNVTTFDDTFNVPQQWNAAYPLMDQFFPPLPLVQRVLDDPELAAVYRGYVRQYLEGAFRPDRVTLRLDQLYALIADDLADDPFPAVRVTHPNQVGYPAILDDLKRYPQIRYDVAYSQLGP